ncbi:MAG: ABC transporter ATP-binding protein [Nitrospinota bacterium]
MASIRLVSLRKEFGGGVVAVENTNLTIEEGEFVVFVGPSGCGKTTTLRMIAGLEDPTRGEIYIGERIVNDLDPGQRDIGLVFQNLALFPHMRVFDNIGFGPKMKKVDPKERRRRVEEVARMVRIHHLLPKLPGQLSGGEAQRVALARTLITHPQAFLLDEPLSNLDAKLRKEMRAEIDRLHKELKKTFVYVTHDQEEAMTLADRIIVMRDGHIEQMGTPLEIYHDPVNRFVADFFGSPPMNLLEGEMRRADGVASFRAGEFHTRLPEPVPKWEGKAILGIRPEHIEVRLGTAPRDGDLQAKVALVEPLGKDTLLYLDYGDERSLIAILEGHREIKTDSTISYGFRRDRLYFFGPDDRRLLPEGAPAATS